MASAHPDDIKVIEEGHSSETYSRGTQEGHEFKPDPMDYPPLESPTPDVPPKDKKKKKARRSASTPPPHEKQRSKENVPPPRPDMSYRDRPPSISSSDPPSDPSFYYDEEHWKQRKRQERKEQQRRMDSEERESRRERKEQWKRRKEEEDNESIRHELRSLIDFLKAKPKESYIQSHQQIKGMDQVDSKSDKDSIKTESEVDLSKLDFLSQDLQDFLLEVRSQDDGDEGFSKQLKKLNRFLKKIATELIHLEANVVNAEAMAILMEKSGGEYLALKASAQTYKLLIQDKKKDAAHAIKEIKQIRKDLVLTKPVLMMPKLFTQATKQFLWQDYYNIRDTTNTQDASKHLKINWGILRTFGQAHYFKEEHYISAFYYMLTSDQKEVYDEMNLGSEPLKEILKRMSDHYIQAKSLSAKRDFADQIKREAGEDLRTAVRRYERSLTAIAHQMPSENVKGWMHEKMKSFILNNTTDSVKIALVRKEGDARKDGRYLNIEEILNHASHEEGIIYEYEKYRPNSSKTTAFQATSTQDEVDESPRPSQMANPAVQRKPANYKKKPYGRNPEKREFQEISKPKAQQIANQVVKDSNQVSWKSPPQHQYQPKRQDATTRELNDLRKQVQRQQKQLSSMGGQQPYQGQPPPAVYQRPPQQPHYSTPPAQHSPRPQGFKNQQRGSNNGPPRTYQNQGGSYPRPPQGYGPPRPQYVPQGQGQRVYPQAPHDEPSNRWKKKNKRYLTPEGTYILPPGTPAAVVQGHNFQNFYQPQAFQKPYQKWNPQHANQAQGQVQGSYDNPYDHPASETVPHLSGNNTMHSQMVTFPAMTSQSSPLTYAAVAGGQTQQPPSQPAPRIIYPYESQPMQPIATYYQPGEPPQVTANRIYGDAVYKISIANSLISNLKNNCERLRGVLMETFPTETLADMPYVYMRKTYHPELPNILIVVAIVGLGPPRRIHYKGSLYSQVHIGQENNNVRTEFTQLMQMPNQRFDVIQMSSSATCLDLRPGDIGYIDVKAAMQLRKENPELYAASKNMPYRYYWRKERDQILLKNNPQMYKDLIKKEDVVLKSETPIKTPKKDVKPHSATTPKKPKAKAMVSGQNVQHQSSFIKSKEQESNETPEEFRKPPMYREVFYEQADKFDPKAKEYHVFKLDINKKLPTKKFVKAAGLHYKPVKDLARLKRFQKDHWQKKEEISKTRQPELELQRRLYFEEMELRAHKAVNEDTVDTQEEADWQERKKTYEKKNRRQELAKRRDQTQSRVQETQVGPMQANMLMMSNPAFLNIGPQPPKSQPFH